MSTPPQRNDDNGVFQVGASGQAQPRKHEEESLKDDLVEEVVDAINLQGCLLRPIIWLATLPLRLILRIIEAIFE